MKQRVFRYYTDPGHGWTRVSKEFLKKLLGSDWRLAFTHFSYERSDYVYLEEDEDTSRLVTHCRKAGIEPIFKPGSNCGNRLSRIRNYAFLSHIEVS